MAPDVGDLFEHDGQRFRVTSWLKALPECADLRESTQQRCGPDNKRLVWCTREDAEYVAGYGVCGIIVRVADVIVTGRVGWPEEVIDRERDQALMLVGKGVA
jgi:hypothetical protein